MATLVALLKSGFNDNRLNYCIIHRWFRWFCLPYIIRRQCSVPRLICWSHRPQLAVKFTLRITFLMANWKVTDKRQEEVAVENPEGSVTCFCLDTINWTVS
ncbi:unnamed protein product [Arctogadus glacialis]